MALFLGGFCLGTLLLQASPRLWPAGLVLALGLLLGLLLGWAWQRTRMRPLLGLLGVLLGCVLAHERAVCLMASALAPQWEGQVLALEGEVLQLSQPMGQGERILFHPLAAPAGIPEVLSLAWFTLDGAHSEQPLPSAPLGAPLRFHPGQRWRLWVRLKSPHGLVNPGGFDLETWSFMQGIRATGTIVPGAANHCLYRPEHLEGMRPALWVEQLRDLIRQRILSQLSAKPWAGVLVALVVGDQSGIPPAAWPLFWNTGVGHLISISGLHITMLAGLVARIVGWFWPSVRVRWVTTLVAAWAYALLAGFSVPTQRTLYMIATVTLTRFARRPAPTHLVLLMALSLTLCVDPWAPLAVGFWLSFGAVALLMYAGAQRVGPVPLWRDSIHTQWVATWAMVPLLMALFGQVSLVSPLANALAIPVVSLGVVPLALLGVVPGFGWALTGAHGLFSAVATYLQWLAHWSGAVWYSPLPTPALLGVGFLGLLFWLAPAGWPGRAAGCTGLLALLLAPPPRPAPEALRMVVLDVGQGLAVILQTHRHTLVVDTGPRYGRFSDAGTRVILPALRALGVTHLDAVIITHQDLDHRGGAKSLLQGIGTDWLLSALPPAHPLWQQVPRAWSCVAGQHWEWDGVAFDLLLPLQPVLQDVARQRNDHGCVLRVSVQGKHLLLPADIGREGEQTLLSRMPRQLQADVLIAPHHGSQTSSSAAFIAAVAPRWVLFAVGFHNHFRHPAPAVLARYAQVAARWLRTDLDGALYVDVVQQQIRVSTERSRFAHYWWGAPTRVP